MKYLQGDYCYHLNSEDLHDPDLPLIRTRSHGGTLMLWSRALDPYIEVYSTTSTAFLPIILKVPGLQTSIHVALYLPTQGRDTEFVSELANLHTCLESLLESHNDAVIYVRGDCNVNQNNCTRVALLKQFLEKFSLKLTDINHNTYHHFVGNGMYDSKIDILAHSSKQHASENVVEILCKHDYPASNSHHDIILSQFTIPCKGPEQTSTNLITAPRCSQPRTKIIWSEEGQAEYAALVGPYLKQAREDWLNGTSQVSMSILLQITNNILNTCASITNKAVTLGIKKDLKSVKTPKIIRKAKLKMIKTHKRYKLATQNPKFSSERLLDAKSAFKISKKLHDQAVKQCRLQENIQSAEKLSTILSKNPSAAYSFLKSSRNTKSAQIECLKVADKIYSGSAVCDGFYDSMSSLKQCNLQEL